MNYSLKLRDHERAAKKLGNIERVVSGVRNGKGKGADDFLMTILGIDRKMFTQISDMIDNCPDWTDEDIAAEIIGE